MSEILWAFEKKGGFGFERVCGSWASGMSEFSSNFKVCLTLSCYFRLIFDPYSELRTLSSLGLIVLPISCWLYSTSNLLTCCFGNVKFAGFLK